MGAAEASGDGTVGSLWPHSMHFLSSAVLEGKESLLSPVPHS